MTTYFCKCGRQVKKATNADNTGNRDTEGCAGCPYLLPWGPFVWDEVQKAFTQDIKGQECRMSPAISYTTTYRGQANDKCTLHIVSMDLDFLEEVQAWIYDNAADTLTAGFSRGSMRAVDFSDQGRYSLSISCAQNKKGMAAKAALLDRFFTAGRVRRDMSPAQEKAHILAVIKKGREQAQGKDTTMKKQNDRCPLQQECERTCKVIGHERDCDYYVNNRYCTEGIPDQDELLAEEEIRQEREREERYLASLSAEPAEPVVYQNEYGTLFAVREHKGAPALMCRAKGADSWTLSGVLAAVQGEAYTASDLQEVLDEYARAHGWKKAAPEQTKEDYSPCEGCRCPACDDPDCTQAHCDKSDKGFGCIGPGEDCPPENPTFSDAATVAAERTVAAPGPSDSTSMMAAPAAKANEPQDDATESVLAMASGSTAFDFGADAETNAALMQDAQIFMAGSMARVMAAKRAHDRTANNYRGSWGKWCDLVGISRDTGDNMVRVAEQFGNIQIDGQNLIDIQPLKLLYATSKPSTPPEIREKVENLDITTYKQYQDLLARYNAEKAAREQSEREREEAITHIKAARDMQIDTAHERDEACRRAAQAENRAAGAQKLADQRAAENTELKAKLRELESRPVDVAVAQPGQAQIEAWRKEGEARVLSAAKDLAGKARQSQQQAECHASDLEEENNRLRDALNRTRQLDQSAALACGACSAALGAWFESTARDVPADLGPALIRMKRLRLALDIAIENGVWPDDAALDDLEANGNG